ncbi:MAG: cell envelope integrity protein TolA [Moraxellaceae bacterium]|nr:cell envelope integrity protein TolA [Moraxellaceae bacterium]
MPSAEATALAAMARLPKALRISLALHGVLLALVFLLPHLHHMPDIPPQRVIEAVLVSTAAPVPTSTPTPAPTPAPRVPEPAPQPEPPPEPLPEPAAATAAPVPAPAPPPLPVAKIPAPNSIPVREPVPEKPAPAPAKPVVKKPVLDRSALDAEMEALNREMREQQAKADAERLQREMAQSAAAARAAATQQIIDKYRRLITQRVSTKWNRPASARHGMVTVLRISVLPGGEVASVVTQTSSGDSAFDASAEDAVRRSNPLPVPDDVAVFNQNFRSFTFRFNPEDL